MKAYGKTVKGFVTITHPFHGEVDVLVTLYCWYDHAGNLEGHDFIDGSFYTPKNKFLHGRIIFDDYLKGLKMDDMRPFAVEV